MASDFDVVGMSCISPAAPPGPFALGVELALVPDDRVHHVRIDAVLARGRLDQRLHGLDARDVLGLPGRLGRQRVRGPGAATTDPGARTAVAAGGDGGGAIAAGSLGTRATARSARHADGAGAVLHDDRCTTDTSSGHGHRTAGALALRT